MFNRKKEITAPAKTMFPYLRQADVRVVFFRHQQKGIQIYFVFLQNKNKSVSNNMPNGKFFMKYTCNITLDIYRHS